MTEALSLDTVLVANRGEIARRVMRTARELGMRTVAVFSEADRAAPHVREADEAVCLGSAPARDSYLRGDLIIAAALRTGAGLLHPGYGFLSESAAFAREVEAAGLRFVGPTPEQISAFGEKHSARRLAENAGVPMLAGSGLLSGPDEAADEAARIGLPVMVKATGGGGGIGMTACTSEEDVRTAYERVARLAQTSFGTAGVFLEHLVRPARHVEVQVFGDGEGQVAVLGDRDCSLQRRNQKVVEEAPAPALPEHVRTVMHDSARQLAKSVSYRSAGTVEFVYDPGREVVSFLEVNTRLQVEHAVTEQVMGIDIVALMLKLARDGVTALPDELFRRCPTPKAYAVEARVYAEDPAKDSLPSSGLVTRAVLPETSAAVRVDSWIESGLEVSPHYDPLLAKVIATGSTRDEALDTLGEALAQTRIDGIVTNVSALRAMTTYPELRSATHSTTTLAERARDGRGGDPDPRIDVLDPGVLTTVQDLPGRVGYWQVGVPPSGPFDPVSFAEANLAVGNDRGAPGLEVTVPLATGRPASQGPALVFSDPAVVCVTGAPMPVNVDGVPAPQWEPIEIPAGATLRLGRTDGPGLRTYIAVRGGLDVPDYLGSASTFTLGGFGGHAGRALQRGDVLRPGDRIDPRAELAATPESRRTALTNSWEIGVTEGPHGAPEFFTRADMDQLYATSYQVHHNSARTGVRLIGPKPTWARADGGEAGLHPSNIHDTPYTVGSLDFTGDTPIILGPDGPSLGGFVCPAVVASGELWKIGQLRPGDTVRFVPVREGRAASLVNHRASLTVAGGAGGDGDDGVLGRLPETPARPEVTYRRSGDNSVLVEYGPMTLDLGLRMRVHALQSALAEHAPAGIIDVTPGIRSLQVHTDSSVLRAGQVAGLLRELEEDLPASSELTVPSRRVRLPLSWDDPATREAIERYTAGVRDDAPWAPWNIEFIRRINGLASVEDVHRIVFDASYLVLGLGDVYLGAPVSTPLDPRHRLVTTKYNPARTWTAENSVGIGGAYMCIYGMEGPGGYQLVGRTTQVFNRFRSSTSAGGLFQDDPWALRFFDRIEWYPVSADELLELRAEVDAGRGEFETEEGTFSIKEYDRFLTANADSIAAFRDQQSAAFDEERERWKEAGEFDICDRLDSRGDPSEVDVPGGCVPVTAPFTSTVWKVVASRGSQLAEDAPLMVVEAMKMEASIPVPVAGEVVELYVRPGEQIVPGQVIAAVRPVDGAGS
ncbi:urea carboxylase [Nocardioides luteus]|uniref:Urea carboxylase n=1 Tax=Nocardioides luteus TaxID=1844 RepID=A0ABQ5SYM6_9ACTN|nr:urea carboxylase [Nocardioides luteus]MDR7312886.1 urea carboxylase [Nocardioides luteus]GGR48243.1 urea carboxylase [Nocardioides luteus]GLJ69140.1 urea carboxylase [Nocardioides luteus]